MKLFSKFIDKYTIQLAMGKFIDGMVKATSNMLDDWTPSPGREQEYADWKKQQLVEVRAELERVTAKWREDVKQ